MPHHGHVEVFSETAIIVMHSCLCEKLIRLLEDRAQKNGRYLDSLTVKKKVTFLGSYLQRFLQALATWQRLFQPCVDPLRYQPWLSISLKPWDGCLRSLPDGGFSRKPCACCGSVDRRLITQYYVGIRRLQTCKCQGHWISWRDVRRSSNSNVMVSAQAG